MRSEETDVLIVGSNVAGLSLALESFRRGFRARLLDARSSRLPPSRAAYLQPKALEAFSRLEIYDILRREGAIVERIGLYPAGSAEPITTLDYAHVGLPFPHALVVPEDRFRATVLDAFAKYRAVAFEQRVEMLSLFREGGRVQGAKAQGPDGEITYRAKVIAVTTAAGGAPVRAEVGASIKTQAYAEEHAMLELPVPEGWGAEAALWMGPGISVLAYPLTERRLFVEAIAAGGILAGAKGGGTEAVKRLFAPVAPKLERALASLRSADDMVLASASRSFARTWVGEAVALAGPAALAMSPWGLNVATQGVLDAATLARVLSKALFTGDVSRLALKAYEDERREPALRAQALSDDLHRAGVAKKGVHGRARVVGLERLRASEELRRKIVRSLAGHGDDPLTTSDRLRLAGLLPGAKPA